MNCYLSTTFDGARRTPTAVLRELRAHGVREAELGSTHAPEEGLESSLRDEFGDFALLTHNFFPPPPDSSLVINFSDPRPAARAQSLALATENVRFASRVGSRLHTAHPGFLAAATPGAAVGRNYDFTFDATSGVAPAAAFQWMLEGLAPLAREAAAVGVPLALETQGSIESRDFCLLQTSGEIASLRTALPSRSIGISVNIGHLNLAASAWGFDRARFIDDVADDIVAFELSHNDGRQDSHLPLQPEGWYWDIICDPRFREVPMILELREIPVAEACRYYHALANRRAKAGGNA